MKAIDKKKRLGATYTPSNLANYLSLNILDSYKLPKRGFIRILDPACGDGMLLRAIIDSLPDSVHGRLKVRGCDLDSAAVSKARLLYKAYPNVDIKIIKRDFIKDIIKTKFDIVIANPPYVRSQTLGSDVTRKLANDFNLSGSIDLYYPFILNISNVLAESGVAGILTSNRFMTTRSGNSIRKEILTRFDVLKVFDLGDTKLFEASVLPAILIASKKTHLHTNLENVAFSSIYETKEEPTIESSSVLEALSAPDTSVVRVNEKAFKIRHGTLNNGGDSTGVWRNSTPGICEWLNTVESNTSKKFSDIGSIRVGVKSAADKIFLRSDWDELSTGRPELLRPLITGKHARRFKSKIPKESKHQKEILYPHTMTKNGRAAVDIDLYPKSKSYLMQHKHKLEGRNYLISAGKEWYELWMPQDPSSWSAPKLVFLDISEKPTFWIDKSGAVVNGECYWIKNKNKEEEDLLWLALAVGNSSFIEKFYDYRFNNKLYAGRRRFITQYVEKFPLPDVNTKIASKIIFLSKKAYICTPSKYANRLIDRIDRLVYKAFGV